jgi:hypothetical protein
VTRPTDAIVIGFTKSRELCRRAFAPLLELRQQGVLRNIHYVTWDSAEIDDFVAPVTTLDGIQIARVPQPETSGNRNQRGIVYQTRNLEVAFARVREPDALVVKLRPDFVFRAGFLRAKLQGFERVCGGAGVGTLEGIALPSSPFQKKIWIAWADANQPFFYDDAAFIGLKSDLAKLIDHDLGHRLPLLEDLSCGFLVHVLRYASVFLADFPIFARYVREYGAFVNDMDYRKKLVPFLLSEGFFWHLLVVHAWILHTSFHVDCGRAGDLAFYPNTINADVDWHDLNRIRLATPFDQVEWWRAGTEAGQKVLPALVRNYGRLVDDAWPRALFAQPMTDVPPDMIRRLLRGAALYGTGCLDDTENAFYAKLAAFHRAHRPAREAA